MNGEMGSRVIREISMARMSEVEKEEMKKELSKIDERNLAESEKQELKKKIEDKKVMSLSGIRKLRLEMKIVMWKFYSQHKSSLPDDIREYREEIIVELMKGQQVEEVFDSYGGVPAPSAQMDDIAA